MKGRNEYVLSNLNLMSPPINLAGGMKTSIKKLVALDSDRKAWRQRGLKLNCEPG